MSAKSVTVATKITLETSEAIDAARGDLTRSAWVANAIAQALGAPDPVATAPEPPAAPPAEADCTHPKSSQTTRPYGTFCACGKKIR